MTNESAPVVGVLSTVQLSTSDGLPVGQEAKIFTEQFTIAQKYGITMFLFFPDKINWTNRTIKGYIFLSNKEKQGYWVKMTFPFPDVVYNRIRYRKIEKSLHVKQLLQKFDTDPYIQLFNTRFLDKWEVYQALAKNPATAKMVPCTRLFSSRNLKYLSSKYRGVFIKPRNNNAGRGIIKVRQKTFNSFNYCRTEFSPLRWKKRISFNGLLNNLSILIKKRKNYLIQKGIKLCKINGRVVDFRAQVQKDGNGQWIFTGLTVRVAGKNRPVTSDKNNLPPEASFAKVLDIVSGGSKAFKNKVNLQLANLYQSVPLVLEKKLGLSLAVLSIDIGLDVHGKIWVIEVSSKPSPFYGDDIRRRQFQYLMEYLLYITTGKNKKA